MPIRLDDFADSEKTYATQLNSQIEQVSRSLMHLDKLLVAGLVDRRVLTSFREAVDRVRTTGFVVQQAIEGTRPSSQITEAILSERMAAATRTLKQLVSDLQISQPSNSIQGSEELVKALQLLLTILQPK
jgi:ATP/maltotriose-dependent transcriptional regulator MalT